MKTVGLGPNSRRRLATSAFFFHAVAQGLGFVAVGVWSFERGGPTYAAVIALIRYGTATLVAPLWSAWIDRAGAHRVYRTSLAIQILGYGASALRFLAGNPLVFVPAVISRMAITAIRPAHFSLLPELVDNPAQLASTTSRSRQLDELGMLVGSVSAAALQRFGTDRVFFGACIVAALSLGLLQAVGKNISTGGLLNAIEILNERVPVGRALRAATGSRSVLLLVGLKFLIVGVCDVLFLSLAERVSGSSSGAGLLFAAYYGGSMLGNAQPRRLRATPTALIGFGAAVALTTLLAMTATTSILLIASALIFGIGVTLVDANGRVLLARALPMSLLARVYGLQETAGDLGSSCGVVFGPLLVSLFSLDLALLLTATLLPVAAITRLRSLRSLNAKGEERQKVVSLIFSSSLFRGASVPMVAGLAHAMTPRNFIPNEVVMREGDIGDAMYLIERGTIAIATGERPVAQLGPGDHVGELALLYDIPRTATAIATEPVVGWRLEREPFRVAVLGISNDSPLEPVETKTHSTDLR